jgi:hypothetical protein
MTPTGDASPVPSRPRVPAKRSWLWFFLVLVAAGLCAVLAPLVYNLRQQLQPETLDSARARWQENGPRDYDLFWQVRQNEEPRADEYQVTVRDGQVWVVHVNNEVWVAKELAIPLGGAVGATVAASASERLPQRELTGYTVEGLFRSIEEDLRKNAESGGRNFSTATFDTRDGHPIRYIYRVKRSPERVEWNVKLVRP